MANVFDQFDAAQPSPFGNRPVIRQTPDPYKAEDQQIQRDNAARAAAAEQRAQEEARRKEMEWNATHNPDGTPKPSAVKDPKTTQDERAAAGYYRRALNAHKSYGEGVLPRAPVLQTLVDILPDDWENSLDGPTRRAAKNYADEFIRAKLRKESGAAISQPEMESEYRIYFPVPGDTKEDLDRKAGLREQAIEALKIGAGSEADKAVEGLPAAKQLAPEQEQELIQILRTKGPEAANEYLSQFGKSLQDPQTAAKTTSNEIAYAPPQNVEPAGLTDIVVHGATLGLSDEAAGVGNALANIIMSPLPNVDFNPVGAYQEGTARERQALDLGRQQMGWGGTAAELGGSLLSGNVSSALKVAPNLIGRMAQGAKAGATAGGVAGFGYGEDQNSLLSALGGAAGGAVLGGALPVAGQFISDRAQAVRRLTGKDPNLARNIVGEAMEADGLTPSQVGAKMDDAHSRGAPMMIADTGENSRQLLASVGRQPGPSRTIVKNAVIERQNAQAERIGEAVARDLGPTANIREMGDELITRAQTAASPLYDSAYAAPGATAVKLDDLATRPSFQKALGRAIQIAREEGVDPTRMGFDINQAGEIIAYPNVRPTWQALDYLKRGLDDVVEGYRNQLTGKLELDNEGRAVNATLRTLLARMDKINPDYAAARAAYAGPARMRDALEKGAKALAKSPDDIAAMMKGMGEGEQDAFRLGVRKAITDLLASRKDGGDKVSALLGTPKSRAALSRVFGGKAEYERFIATLRDEEAMGHTYKAVAGNSLTAERSAQDAATGDSGLADAIVGAAATGNPSGIIASAVAKLQNVGKFGAGEAGKRTRESVAALLTETDPDLLRELIRAAQSAAAKQRAATIKRGKNVVRTGRNAGDLTGMGLGSLQQPQKP